MKRVELILGCVMGLTMVVMASEPAMEGERPGLARLPGGSEMREGGDMMVLRPAVAKALQLTAEQQAQMTSVAVASSNEMSGLREQMQKLARKQAALMGAEPVDETAVLALADDIGKVRSEMAKVQVKQMLAVRKILTPEQRLKMREKMKNNMGKHEGKRPGPRLNKGEKRPGGEAPPPPAAAPPPTAAE